MSPFRDKTAARTRCSAQVDQILGTIPKYVLRSLAQFAPIRRGQSAMDDIV
jgi:hypothetical protein